MTVYAERALAIQNLTTDLRRRMEVTAVRGTLVDKAALIDLAVEVINKVVECFLVFPEKSASLSVEINRQYASMEPSPQSIIDLFFRIMERVRHLEQKALEWVARYCK